MRSTASRVSRSPGIRISSKPAARGVALARSTRASSRASYSAWGMKRFGRMAMNRWPTFCGRSMSKYWLPTSPPKAAPDITPAMASIIRDRPEPLGPPTGSRIPL